MADYSIKTEDQYGRQIRPVLFNTAKDGSGTWYFALVDSSGQIILGTSTAAIGKLASNSGVDIGDVDILSIAAGTNVIGKVQEDFGGNVYSKTMTMVADTATRFETTAKKLRDATVLVETNTMLLGETGVEVYTLAAGGTVKFTKIDISTLYFKNAAAGVNGKITIIGVEE